MDTRELLRQLHQAQMVYQDAGRELERVERLVEERDVFRFTDGEDSFIIKPFRESVRVRFDEVRAVDLSPDAARSLIQTLQIWLDLREPML